MLCWPFSTSPPEHWDHLRTSTPIESVFATVRHRTVRTADAAREHPRQIAARHRPVESSQCRGTYPRRQRPRDAQRARPKMARPESGESPRGQPTPARWRVLYGPRGRSGRRSTCSLRSDLRRGRLRHGFDRPFQNGSGGRGSGSLAVAEDHCGLAGLAGLRRGRHRFAPRRRRRLARLLVKVA
jgi:hypothetical protein